MIEIKCRCSGRVLWSHNGDSIKIAVEAAAAAGANLDGAYLDGANLARAYLAGANLAGAYLAGANLAGAYLAGAYLAGANLAGAYLDGANLDRAYLGGANLAGANLAGAYLAGAYLAGANLAGAYLDGSQIAVGDRPIIQIGPLGSRAAYLIAWLTCAGIYIRAGCFWGTRDEFAARVKETHGNGIQAQEYEAALALIDAHARLWMPKEGEARP